MHHYQFGGAALSSTIALDGLRPLPPGKSLRRAISVIAESGPAPIEDVHHFAWPGRYQLRLGEHRGAWLMQSALGGAFLIDRDASAVRVFGWGGSADQAINDVFVRRVLPRMTNLLGATAIHAASLAGPRGGVLLLGPSGAGKSTLSAALSHLAGWKLLGDDMATLWTDDQPSLAPAAKGVCVWPESRAGLGLPLEECRELPGYGGKLAYQPAYAGSDEPVPLRNLLFLKRSPDIEMPSFDKLSQAEAIAEVVPQIIHFNPNGSAGAERVAALRSLSRAIDADSAWRLHYPASYAGLPGVVDRICELLN